MPAVSKKQQKFMALCATNPSKARKSCPPTKTAREFMHRPVGGYGKGKGR